MEAEPIFLIAEDDPDDQFLIQSIAKEVCPPEVVMHFVADGFELLDFLQVKVDGSTKPNLIMVDLNMPLKDGREALKDIKANPALANIPTVILTTSNQEEDIQYCQSFGIEGYYIKSSSISELREIIATLCEEYLESF